MAENLEIERKFLVEIPDSDCLDIRKKLDITQTYLADGFADGNVIQRRVRRIKENSSIKYFYTEKIFLSPIERIEDEHRISHSDYDQLLQERKTDYAEIKKQRICFQYRNQLFEMDIYPFSAEFAILELELDSPEQEIFYPENVKIIKEVTGDSNYSNAALANAGAFPNISISDKEKNV